jgi:hypothetical protein
MTSQCGRHVGDPCLLPVFIMTLPQSIQFAAKVTLTHIGELDACGGRKVLWIFQWENYSHNEKESLACSQAASSPLFY